MVAKFFLVIEIIIIIFVLYIILWKTNLKKYLLSIHHVSGIVSAGFIHWDTSVNKTDNVLCLYSISFYCGWR